MKILHIFADTEKDALEAAQASLIINGTPKHLTRVAGLYRKDENEPKQWLSAKDIDLINTDPPFALITKKGFLFTTQEGQLNQTELLDAWYINMSIGDNVCVYSYLYE